MREFYDGYLWRIEVRYLMTDLMIQSPGRVWKVRELVSALSILGVNLYDRPSKFASDLLRTEVARGRVVRVGWGQYRLGMIPDTTRRRIRKRAQACRAHLADVARQQGLGSSPYVGETGPLGSIDRS